MAILMILIVSYIALNLGRTIGTSGKGIKGCSVAIDPGHGGIDPGKVGVNDELEKDINLEIALKLKKILEGSGIKVTMTRESDMALSSPDAGNKKVSDMKNRMAIVEKSKADIMVSIHQNSYTSSSVKGAQVFYYSRSEKGKALSEIIQQNIRENVDKTNSRAAKANDNYYILLHSACPAVIVECGFLSNHEEAAKLSDEDYQHDMAQAIAEGIKAYFMSGSHDRKKDMDKSGKK